MIRKIALILIAALLAHAPAALAEDSAQEIFDSLYGADVKKAIATSDTKDDAAVAAQLLKAVQTNQVKDELMELMCNKAYELGMKDPSGYDTAAAAMQQLSARIPERRPACTDKLAEIRMKLYLASPLQYRQETGEMCIEAYVAAAALRESAKQYSEAAKLLEKAVNVASPTGSAALPQLREKQKTMAAMDVNLRQVANLSERLKQFPADRPVRAELVRLTLIELDSPAQAKEYVNETSTEAMRTYVPLAAGDVASLAESACMDLGEWYRSLVDGASATAKCAMLKRAKTYYSAYLVKHTADDLGRTKATLALKKTDEALAAQVSETTMPVWTDLLKICGRHFDPRMGEWELVNGTLVAKSGHYGRLELPMSPDGSYEIMMRLRRNDSDDGMGITFPVGTGEVTVLLSNNSSSYHGMGSIGGKGAGGNDTTLKPGKLNNDEPYLLHILVSLQGKNAEVTVSVNGKKAMRYAGPQEALTVEHGWNGMDPRNIYLAVRRSGWTFDSFRARALSGKLNAASQPSAPGVSGPTSQPASQPATRHFGRPMPMPMPKPPIGG